MTERSTRVSRVRQVKSSNLIKPTKSYTQLKMVRYRCNIYANTESEALLQKGRNGTVRHCECGLSCLQLAVLVAVIASFLQVEAVIGIF